MDVEAGRPKDAVLDPQAIRLFLAENGAALPQLDISCLHSVDSTNNRIKEAIRRGAAEGTVVIALEQAGGYGRQGRTWASPLGGLYLSILLQPGKRGKRSEEFASLGLVVSLAVRKAAAALGFPEDLWVKWPNDIVCKRGKLCGVSAEALANGVCVGIGLNVFMPLTEEKLDGKYIAAYAVKGIRKSKVPPRVPSNGLTPDQLQYMEQAAAVLLNEVVCAYERWLVEGFLPFRDEYRAHAFLQGKNVQLVSLTNDILHEGVVFDVDADGCLCLVDGAGMVVHAHSGEVHLR